MNANQLLGELENELESLPQKRTAPMRRVRRAFSRRLEDQPAALVIALAQEMVSRNRHRWIAYELIADHPKAYRSLDRETVERLGQGINSWDTVDTFARTISGPAWRDGLLDDETIHAWAQSPDRWWRRASLVSTVALNIRSHGGYGDTERTLAICEMLSDDGDDMVVKALSWALRALVVHDPAAVRAFLNEHDDALATRVKREVTNKLETGLKNP